MGNQKDKLQEMQFLEQNLQNILFQKQAFQMELSETSATLKEIDLSGEDVFKLIGQLMIKADKNKIKEELKNKEKLLDLRLSALEKQEQNFSKKLDDIRKNILEK